MRQLIAKVALRNEYAVYECSDHYEVEATQAHGTRYIDEVPNEAVELLKAELKGRSVTVEEAADALELAAEHLSLPYAYGHKLKFYAQTVLVVLVALTVASHEKAGRRFLYTIRE